jgi:hypothetical protein
MKTKIMIHHLLAATLLVLAPGVINASQGPQPSICTRSCWGARASTGCSTMSSLTRAIIHHTAGQGDYTTSYETGKIKCRGVQNYHMDVNGWCDVAYHFMFNAGGHIYEGRVGSMNASSWYQGAHDGCNSSSMGFSNLGYYHPPYNQAFTSAQRNALEACIAWRMPSSWSATGSGTYCGASVGTLDGHYKVKSTACPGDGIIPSIPGIRTGVMNRKNGTPPPPAEVTSPSIVTRTDGKIFAFGITTSGAIQYRQKISINATWGTWVDLGGSGFTFIRALPMTGGGVAVFGMGSGNIYYRYLASSGSGIWSGWVNVGGSGFISIAPIMKSDGKMALVGCGSNSSIFYQEQTAVGPDAGWTGWGDLVASSFWQVDALPLPNGGAAVFGMGDGGGAWYKYKTSSTASWSSWVNLSGSSFSRISAVMGTTGKMAFFGSADGAGSPIWYQEQTGVGATAGWSGWINLGGGGYSSISGVALPGGGLAVFGCQDDASGSSVFYKKRASETAAWSGYVDLTASSARRVSATADANGLMSVVMRGGTGGSLWERAQTDANHWSGWVNLGNALK